MGRPLHLVARADQEEVKGAGGNARVNKALRQAKCESECRMMKGRDHGTIMRNVANEDDPTTQAILEFLAKHTDLELKTKGAK
jgi:hypothetical protein